MKLVIQRVSNAKVEVDNKVVGKIGKGFLVLFGAGQGDTEKQADSLAEKLCNLRVFKDENNKMNLSIKDINGELLIVSQFTLYADCKKGNRPSFVNAAPPDEANNLYKYFLSRCRKYVRTVEEGIFGAYMQVSLLNDGPVTIILEK